VKSRLIHALCGVAVAVSARYLLPGEHPHGYLLPVLLGAIGGWIADWIGQRAGLYRTDQPASFVMSVLGAMALMLVYGVVGH
jgi:uncharacterized membrane protein YeaQ/YmgE (transglycosylase-associated protein family)